MADPKPDNADASGEDANVRAEWQRLERRRLDEEIAEGFILACCSHPMGQIEVEV